ncbi:VCBS domain-containing protein, partial [Sphingomonas sp. ASV193]|uniref:beta strand repeat-containing protein n=1 Tax=Sphingomonas sp. ASV193 TaxID=3144405 RepID=UPI0032E85B1B
MRYDDASSSNIHSGNETTGSLAAHNDLDIIPAHSSAPASGNVISGAGTFSGQAGEDALGAGRAHITAIQGAGGSDSTVSGGHLMVAGRYGTLTIDAQGNYKYVPHAGHPNGATDVFTYTLTDKAGEHSTAQLAIRFELDPDKLSKAEQISVGPDGVVVLPAGVSLEDVHVIGRDLVIDMPDGTQRVIHDGAVFVPQLVLNGVEVPSTTLASLLIDSEVQPAAGPPQSSGGNFEIPVPPLDPGVPLGDLIPPTEMGYTPPDFNEVTAVIDNKPSVVIEPHDVAPGLTAAEDSVNEAGLPARGLEPAGSNSASNSETTNGTIVVTSLDTPNTITITGVDGPVTVAVGAVIHGQYGDMTITAINGGNISYTYTLADNTNGDATQDVFAVKVVDATGDVATASLTIHIADDVPTARNDSDSLDSQSTHATGNVISGAGTDGGTSGPGVDTQGADGAKVTAIAAAGHTMAANADGSFTVQGSHGTLTIYPDGHYDYAYTPGATGGGGTDTFTYTLTDGDGDTSSATLTIALPNSPPTIHVVDYLPQDSADNQVFENLLPAHDGEPAGSAYAGGGNPTAAGDVAFTSLDGVQSMTFTIPGGGTVTLTLAQLSAGSNTVVSNGSYSLVVSNFTYDASTGNGTLHYVFTLNDNTIGSNSSEGGDTHVQFGVSVTDRDGQSSSDTLDVRVVDDHPTAHADVDAISDGASHPADGNVITGVGGSDSNGTDGVVDTQGADGAHVTGVAAGDTGTAVSGSVATSIAGLYGYLTLNADGSYSYSLYTQEQNPEAYAAVQALGANAHVNDVFTYTITDGDGDTSSTTLTIEVDGTNAPPVANPDTNWVQEDLHLAASGNVLTSQDHPGDPSPSLSFADQADTDADAGTTLTVATAGTYNGNYGVLVINADGSYTYTLYTQAENPAAYAAVQQLGDGETLSESFNYTTSDGSATSGSTLTLTIFGANDPVVLTGLDVEGGEAVVNEANLAAGSNPDATALTQTGSFDFTAADGLGSTGTLTLDGHTLIDGTTLNVGQTITTASGTLTITAIDPVYGAGGSIVGGTISYTYTLQNAVGEPNPGADSIFDSLTVMVTDHDGSTASNTLDIRIIDDVPTAMADSGTVLEGGTQTGNVETNDVFGADGKDAGGGVVGVRVAGGDTTSAVTGGINTTIHGQYGDLVLQADGSYSYHANPNTNPPAGASDVFVYTIKDGDGDLSTTTLTINVADVTLAPDDQTKTVDEAALVTGSNPDSTAEAVSGTLSVSGATGYDAQSVTTAHGIFVLNADGSYTYTLTSPFSDSTGTNNGTTS